MKDIFYFIFLEILKEIAIKLVDFIIEKIKRKVDRLPQSTKK